MSDMEVDSNDIFIEKQIIPVTDLSFQKRFISEKKVLNSDVLNSVKFVENSKKRKKRLKSVSPKSGRKKNTTRKHVKTNNKINSNRRKGVKGNEINASVAGNISKTPFRSVDQFDKQKKSPSSKANNNFGNPFKIKTPEKDNSPKNLNFETVRISPGLARQQYKYEIFNHSHPKSHEFVKVSRNIFEDFNENNKVDDDCHKTHCSQNSESFNSTGSNSNESFISNKSLNSNSSHIKNSPKKTQDNNNSELLCFAFKKILRDEIEHQIQLRPSTLEDNSTQKLLSTKELEILKNFLYLKESASQLYVRMLCRKKGWHRIADINYKDINYCLLSDFELLHEQKFIDLNIEQENVKIQLELLKKPELQYLCKSFNIPCSLNSKRHDMIKSLLQNIKNQRSVKEIFKKTGSVSRVDVLKKEIKQHLGMCMKLKEEPILVFNKIFLLFSHTHYFEEEDKRISSQLQMCIQVHKNLLSFPSYTLTPTVIFETYNDFEMYQKAVLLRDSFETAITSKNQENFQCLADKAKEEFKSILADEEFLKRISEKEPFLRKFNAGTIYAKILTKYCQKFKSMSNTCKIIEIVKILLEQNEFLMYKRGDWYEILSMKLEKLKKNEDAAQVLIQSLGDPVVDEVQKLSLQLRGQMILKKKTNQIKNTQLMEKLQNVCSIAICEPSSILIRGKSLDGNSSGYKSVYIIENNDGKMYLSVEELAILHYKNQGFTKGYHTEGYIIHSIYFLLFFDIIYGCSPPGVFQSIYQENPLDFYSKYFYLNRKKEIDSRLQEMCQWTNAEVEEKLTAEYIKNFNVRCLIKWNENFTPELFCDFIKCIQITTLSYIFRRFVNNFRIVQSGFPDLTLWNSETRKCKFVEVKSPNDKLSVKQRLWLDYLQKIGVDCEVCNIKS